MGIGAERFAGLGPKSHKAVDVDAALDVQWNTGAHYTAEGQVIRAKVEGDSVRFVDFSRGIWGVMALPTPAEQRSTIVASESRFKEWVHGKYLRNDYTPTFELPLPRKH